MAGIKCVASRGLSCLFLVWVGCDGDPPPEPPPPPPADIQIQLNELASSGTDPVELHNVGDETVDLGDWILTDDIDHGVNASLYDPATKVGELIFDAGTLIAPGGYLVVHKGEGAGMHPFGLSGAGETVTLLNKTMSLVDQVTYGVGRGEVSYCRLAGGWQECEPTFGTANIGKNCGNDQLDEGELCDGQSGLSACDTLGGFTGGQLSCAANCMEFETHGCERPSPPACDVSGLRLNEVCHKARKCGVEGVTQGDWMELYNEGETAADVSGCFLRIYEQTGELRLAPTQLASVRGFEFATVPAGGYWVLDHHKDVINMADDNSVELLGGDGETVVNRLITSSAYWGEGEACSIDAVGDVPTPGAANVCQGR